MKPIVGITMGDASGIGTEIIAKALSIKEIYELCHPLVIGDARAMDKGVTIGRDNSTECVQYRLPGCIYPFDIPCGDHEFDHLYFSVTYNSI